LGGRLIKQLIQTLIEKEFDKRFTPKNEIIFNERYQPLSVIKGKLFEWLAIPFFGRHVFIQVRYPRGADFYGNEYLEGFTQIVLDPKKMTALNAGELIETMNCQEAIAKMVMNNPTYEEFEKMILGEDRTLESMRQELEKIKLKTKDAAVNFIDGMGLNKRIEYLNMRLGYLLPADTMTALTLIGLGIDCTDIRKVTEKILLEAYQKHKLFEGSPKDYIAGIFTDKQGDEIERLAVAVGEKHKKDRF
jgi:hypothetical protein